MKIIKEIIIKNIIIQMDIYNIIDENKIIKKQILKCFIDNLTSDPFGLSKELLIDSWRRSENNVKANTVKCSYKNCNLYICTLYNNSGLCSKHKPRNKDKTYAISSNINYNKKCKCEFTRIKSKKKNTEYKCQNGAVIGKYCKRHAKIILGQSKTVLTVDTKTANLNNEIIDNVVLENVVVENTILDNSMVDNSTNNIKQENVIETVILENTDEKITTPKNVIENVIDKKPETTSENVVENMLKNAPIIRCCYQKMINGTVMRCKNEGNSIFGGLCVKHRNQRRLTCA
jgi:hypothetical protein